MCVGWGGGLGGGRGGVCGGLSVYRPAFRVSFWVHLGLLEPCCWVAERSFALSKGQHLPCGRATSTGSEEVGSQLGRLHMLV